MARLFRLLLLVPNLASRCTDTTGIVLFSRMDTTRLDRFGCRDSINHRDDCRCERHGPPRLISRSSSSEVIDTLRDATFGERGFDMVRSVIVPRIVVPFIPISSSIFNLYASRSNFVK